MEVFDVVEFAQVVGVGGDPWAHKWLVFGAMVLDGVEELVKVYIGESRLDIDRQEGVVLALEQNLG